MRTVSALVLIGVGVFTFEDATAAVLGVPGDFPTIQEALDASEDGDVVLVEPVSTLLLFRPSILAAVGSL